MPGDRVRLMVGPAGALRVMPRATRVSRRGGSGSGDERRRPIVALTETKEGAG